MKYLLLLLLFACAKPEPVQPKPEQLVSGKYRIEVTTTRAIVQLHQFSRGDYVLAEQWTIEDSFRYDFTTLIGDQITFVSYSSHPVHAVVYRNDTIIETVDWATSDNTKLNFIVR